MTPEPRVSDAPPALRRHGAQPRGPRTSLPEDWLLGMIERLSRSEYRYRALLSTLQDVVVSLEADGTVEFVNEAISKYGYAASEVVGTHYSKYVHPDDLQRLPTSLRTVRPGARPRSGEFRLIGKSGTGHLVRATFGTADREILGVATTGVLVDVTAQREAERQLQQSQRLETIGRLAGGIAHDFNNLLVAINGYAELTLAQLPDGPMRADLEEIKRAGERAAALVRQLLAFSRRQVLAPEVINLNDIVLGMDRMLRRLIGEDIAYRTDLDPDLPAVLADPTQMEQVVLNLVVNAREAMPRGGALTVATRSVREERADGDVPPGHVLLTVTDTGIGMDDETRARIFEPFFTTKVGGTGLGLPTVYGIVRQSGGRISVASGVGGSVFRVSLPPHSPADGVAPGAGVAAQRGCETVLVVEDEPTVLELASRLLAEAGYRVLTAGSGAEALASCETSHLGVDLLLTDVVMPHMGGRELADRMRARLPALRVLYMSGYHDAAVTNHGVLSQVMHLVEKPFNGAALLRHVRRVLDLPAADTSPDSA